MPKYFTGTAVAALLITIAVAVCGWPGIYPPYAEGKDYTLMAQGDYRHAYFYYAGRVLHPFLAGRISGWLSLPVNVTFAVLGIVSLFVFSLVVCRLCPWKQPAGAMLAAVFLVSPGVLFLFRNYYFHDLFFAALLGCLFLVYRWNFWCALPVLFLLHLTRESAMFVSLAMVATEALQRRWRTVTATVLVALLGVWFTRSFVQHAVPNKHGMSLVANYVLKVPYNVCQNLLGFVIWTNTNAGTTFCAPRRIVDIPPSWRLGRIERIGVCAWDVGWPADTLKTFLTEFGIAPALLLLVVRRKGFVVLRRIPPWMLLACFYGVLTVVTAPLIGTWPSRYLLYAWPLFWVVVPALLQAAGYKPRPIILAFYALVAWLPVLLDKALSEWRLSTVVTCGLALAIYGLLWKSTALLEEPAEARLPAVGVR